jgi:hypothetical protein
LYSIAIHLNDSSVSIGISNPKTGDLISVERYELEEKKSEKDVLSFLIKNPIRPLLAQANKNTIYSTSPRFTIVPSVFYDKNNLSEISRPIFKTSDTEQLFSQFIPEIDGFLVFPFSYSFYQKLKSEIGHTQISHHFASLISTYHLYYLTNDSDMAFIHYHENQFTLSLFRNKKMILFNVFDMTSFEDVIYYTYYSLEQFGFTPIDTAIHIGGHFKHNPEVTIAFQKYTPTIFQLAPPLITTTETLVSDKIISTIFDLQCG